MKDPWIFVRVSEIVTVIDVLGIIIVIAIIIITLSKEFTIRYL